MKDVELVGLHQPVDCCWSVVVDDACSTTYQIKHPNNNQPFGGQSIFDERYSREAIASTIVSYQIINQAKNTISFHC